MHKKVENIIASARILFRRPSEQKLASDDMRYLLHNILDEYNNKALKRNRDYFTNSELITFVYDAAQMMFTPTLAVSTTLTEFYPVKLMYQLLTDDPDDDRWTLANHVKLNSYPNESTSGNLTYAIRETNLGSAHKPQFRMNVTDEFVQLRRWRLDYRAFPTTILGFADTVPFPQEHTVLLEYALACECLDLVEDNSPDWQAFKQTRAPKLEMKRIELLRAFEDWLDQDIENIIINNKPFHYVNNNPLNRGRFMNLRTDPQG